MFEEQHWSHLPEPACQSSRQQSPSDPAGTECSAPLRVGSLQPNPSTRAAAQRLLCQGCRFHTCFTARGLQPCFVNELLFLWLETLALRLPQQYKQGPLKVYLLFLAAGDNTGRSCKFCFSSEILLQCSTWNSEYRNYMEWPYPRWIPALLAACLLSCFSLLLSKRWLLQAVDWVGKERIAALGAFPIKMPTSHLLKFALSTFLKCGSISLFQSFSWHLSSWYVT